MYIPYRTEANIWSAIVVDKLRSKYRVIIPFADAEYDNIITINIADNSFMTQMLPLIYQ